jgi:nicotinate-nucleotide--dimethylbenzimidazole phosphoribosyltransferase
MNLKEQLQHKIDNKTKPLGALGQLENIALQIGLIQKTLTPQILNPTILVFAADHGLANEKISPYPKDVTYQMAMNFVAGGAAISVFCKNNGVNLKVIDAGVDYDFPEGCGIIPAKIARGSRNMLHEPAMTMDECARALAKGRDFVKQEAANGCNTIGFGEMGIGNTSPSSLLMHAFTGYSIEDCTGRGAGLVGAQLDHKVNLLKKISEKYNPSTPLEKLATFGGLEIAMMVGAILEAYEQGMIILVDGFIASAATLTACNITAAVRDNCIFCHTSNEKGHQLLLQYLKAETVISLRMRLGEGTGVALALPIIRSATHFINQMASFDEAGVSNKA